jgi:hypothetical protein
MQHFLEFSEDFAGSQPMKGIVIAAARICIFIENDVPLATAALRYFLCHAKVGSNAIEISGKKLWGLQLHFVVKSFFGERIPQSKLNHSSFW